MHVMYESYVVGCCLLCAMVPSLLTYIPTLFHLRQPCSYYSKEGVAGGIQTGYMLVYLDPGIGTCSGFTLLVVCIKPVNTTREGRVKSWKFTMFLLLHCPRSVGEWPWHLCYTGKSDSAV